MSAGLTNTKWKSLLSLATWTGASHTMQQCAILTSAVLPGLFAAPLAFSEAVSILLLTELRAHACATHLSAHLTAPCGLPAAVGSVQSQPGQACGGRALRWPAVVEAAARLPGAEGWHLRLRSTERGGQCRQGPHPVPAL